MRRTPMRAMAAARAMLTTPRCLPRAALAIKTKKKKIASTGTSFHTRRAKSLALRNVLAGSSAFGLLTIDIHTSTSTFLLPVLIACPNRFCGSNERTARMAITRTRQPGTIQCLSYGHDLTLWRHGEPRRQIRVLVVFGGHVLRAQEFSSPFAKRPRRPLSFSGATSSTSIVHIGHADTST